MFAIATGSGSKVLLRGTREELDTLSCLYDEVRILRIRTRRAAKLLLHDKRFSDLDSYEVRRAESFAWKDARRIESLPNFVTN